MAFNKFALLSYAILLVTSAGCPATVAGEVALRADGSPGPEVCPEKALEAMKILRLHVGDAGGVVLDANQRSTSPITLYDGPVESVIYQDLGPLESPTRLYGHVWTSGPQAVIRYYAAHPPDGDRIPICAVTRLSMGQLKKLPGSKPGMALLEFDRAGVYIVDEFR